MILSFPYLILISFCRFNSPSNYYYFFNLILLIVFYFSECVFWIPLTQYERWSYHLIPHEVTGLSPHITWGDGVITSYHMRWRGYHLISHEVTGLSPHITWGDGVISSYHMRWRGYHLISHEVTGLSPQVIWGDGVITSYHMRWRGYHLISHEVMGLSPHVIWGDNLITSQTETYDRPLYPQWRCQHTQLLSVEKKCRDHQLLVGPSADRAFGRFWSSGVVVADLSYPDRASQSGHRGCILQLRPVYWFKVSWWQRDAQPNFQECALYL